MAFPRGAMFTSPIGRQIGCMGDVIFHSHVTLLEKYLQPPAYGALPSPTRLVIMGKKIAILGPFCDLFSKYKGVWSM